WAYTAVMVDGLYVLTHQPDLNFFLNYFNNETKHDSIAPITPIAVKILDTGAHALRKQHPCPDYYDAFAKSLKRVVQSGLLDPNEKRGKSQCYIQRLLRSSIL